MIKYTLCRGELIGLLHAATNHVRDFVTDNDGFIDKYVADYGIETAGDDSKHVCPLCEFYS